jgi:hypothetical protein
MMMLSLNGFGFAMIVGKAFLFGKIWIRKFGGRVKGF